jgi:hypothetical protein
MTYFTYRHIRGARGGDEVYAGSTLLGRVTVKVDWRSRLTVSPKGADLFCAIGLGGEPLPDLFLSRHAAAEALYDLASDSSGAEDDGAIRGA